MKEIKIQFELKESGDVVIANRTENKIYTIDFEEKKLTAATLYDTLTYNAESKYVYLDDQLMTDDVTKNSYFCEVREVIKDICGSINKINFPEPESDVEEEIEE